MSEKKVRNKLKVFRAMHDWTQEELARKLGVDLTRITGSGSGGRITDQDVQRAAEGADEASTAPASPPAPTSLRWRSLASRWLQYLST